jgi:ATP-dependent protease HslVU (ClpYQ) peptidase subunit
VTTIIGIEDATGCYLAADNQTTVDNRPFFDPSTPKIRAIGDFLVAAAGSGLACDIVNHMWFPPMLESFHSSTYEFMITDVVPALKRAFEANGFSTSEDETYALLIAFQGHLFEIASDGTVLSREDGIYGIGTGSSFAIGALEAGATLEEAMRIASSNDIYTGGDIQIVRQEQPND